ncbi:MAG: putative amino acid transporter substrate binding protein [Gemmatimonadetes bacterium]|nr:putative amino acid transporter substrate binding protein [Gemmatimonadota bacterium]
MNVWSWCAPCALVLTALLGASATACTSETPYRLAVVLDAAGREGAALAAARINARGGVNGHHLDLLNISTPIGTGRVAVETAERLSSDKSILAVIGHTNSSSSLAASQVYNARHVLQLSPTSTAPLYGRAGPYSYRLVPSDVHQGVFLAEQALSVHVKSPLRVAVMFVNNDYGRPLHGVVVERLRAAHVVPQYDVPYSAMDSAGASEFVGALQRVQPDVLIWLGRSADFAPIARRVRDALPRLVVLASDAFSRGAALVDSARLFDAVRYVRLVNLDRPDTALLNLRLAYRRTGRGELNDQTVLAYDAVTLLAEALKATGAHREALPAWLAELGRTRSPFPGLSGPIEFTAERDRTAPYWLARAGRDERSTP